jgi:hypothetical protein
VPKAAYLAYGQGSFISTSSLNFITKNPLMSITENLENSPVTREKTTHNLGMIYKLPNVFMHSTPNSFLFIKISSYSALSFDRSISCY